MMTYLVAECFLVNFISYKSSNFCSHYFLDALAAINADPVPLSVTMSAILDL